MENLSEKLPESFKNNMKQMLGSDYERYINAINNKPVRGIRVNTKKIDTAEFENNFKQKLEKLSFSSDGYLLESDDKLGNSSEHLAGLIYLQEPSSMFAVCASEIEKETKDLRVLDLCASPGGKSGQIACRISENSLLISNEIIKSRAEVLYSNIERQGFKNVVVTNEMPENLSAFEGYFDYVFVDAPCSGEGMFRKNPETIAEWTEENVKLCEDRQKKILEQAQKLVAKSGKLIYSTCTFNEFEDENIVEWFLKNFDFEIADVPEAIKNITKPAKPNGKLAKARKFFPYISSGEGQFVAVFECNDKLRSSNLHTKKHFRSIERAGGGTRKIFDEWQAQNFNCKISGKIFQIGNNLFLAPSAFDSDLQTAFDELKFVSIGVKLGSIQNGRFEPNHAMFMSFADLFINKIELNEQELKKYIHGEELVTNLDAKGYGIVTSGGFALGGVRISQGKLKNLYPKGLRV